MARRLAFPPTLACIVLGCPLSFLGQDLSAQGQVRPVDSITPGSRVTPIVEIVRRVGPSVVNLYCDVEFVQQSRWTGPRLSKTASLGAGVIVHPSGIVVTNSHVITANLIPEVLRRIQIDVSYRPSWVGAGSEQKQSIKARLLGFEPENDLALLKIDGPGPFPFARIGTSSDLMIGETVIAVGNPFGREGTVTHGIISATNRALESPYGDEFNDIIQTDAPLNAGNSGGPLFNINGDLIGINQAVGIDQRLGRAEGQGLAIPVDRVKRLLEEKFNPFALWHSYVGLNIVETPSGLKVASVDRNSPALQAGLKVDDRVVSLGDYEIKDLLSYNLALLSFSKDATIDVAIERDGELSRVPLRSLDLDQELQRRLGLELSMQSGTRGPIVIDVRPGGPGAELGIQREDVIYAIGNTEVRARSLQDVFLALRDAPTSTLPIVIKRQVGRVTRTYEGELRL